MVVVLCRTLVIAFAVGATVSASDTATPCVTVVEREISASVSPYYGAIYADREDNRLITNYRQSDDNGESWQSLPSQQLLAKGLPHGYRRNPVTALLDPRHNRVLWIVNALDTPDLDPRKVEPPIAQKTYYLRYRVSQDGGQSWLHDKPIVGAGKHDAAHPFDDLWIGKNAIYLGDKGCRPITTRDGRILVPAQMTILDAAGELYKPPRAHTYTAAVVLIGEWASDGSITWRISERVTGDEALSCRGMIEPTIAETRDGRIVMIMRGSNSHDAKIPARKWISVSEDQGETWSAAKAWGYSDGGSFYSPSSMSFLTRHSSGRLFWVGNRTPENASGNLPRHPAVIGELDQESLGLIRSSVVTFDEQSDEDRQQGRLDLSHFDILEHRPSGDFILTYPRAHHSYKSREFAELRLRPSPE
ncbi:sialidase family protein [Novipirellula galeiformis]|nr:sialidase family protein [Novipirellula galeiformis]